MSVIRGAATFSDVGEVGDASFLQKFLVHSSAFFIFTSSLDGARLRATLEQSDGGVNRCGRIELGEHEEGSGESDAEGKIDPKILPRRYE